MVFFSFIKTHHLFSNISCLPCSGPLTSDPAIGWLCVQKISFLKNFLIIFEDSIFDEPTSVIIVFGNKKLKYRYVSGSVSDDNNYLFISASNLTDGNKLFMIDLVNNPGKIQTISDDESTDDNIVDTDGDIFYIFTNYDAPNKRLVKTSANKLNRKCFFSKCW